MKNRRKIILLAVGAAVIVVLIIILLWPHAKTVPRSEETPAPQSATAAPVPANVNVPNAGDKNVPSGVAVPDIQTSAHPSGGSSSFRQFTISAKNDAENNDVFDPATVAVKKGDIVDLEITAVNKNYDFTQPDYGFSAVAVPKGQTTRIQFQALNAGKFTFYCASCGGPAKGPVGYIIITDE